MPKIVTNAIVVQRTNYKDNDRMLTLFSPTLGRVDAVSRGCRRQKSPLLAVSELFCSGEYVLFQSGDHCQVVSCALTEDFFALRNDIDRLAHGMYALELCAAAIQPQQENERLFLLLLRSLAYQCYGGMEPRRVTAVFLMGFTSLIGFRPLVGRCAKCGRDVLKDGEDAGEFDAAFSPELGGVLCHACAAGEPYRLSERDVRYLQSIMRKGLQSLEEDAYCSPTLFKALCQMAEMRMEKPIRSSKMVT